MPDEKKAPQEENLRLSVQLLGTGTESPLWEQSLPCRYPPAEYDVNGFWSERKWLVYCKPLGGWVTITLPDSY